MTSDAILLLTTPLNFGGTRPEYRGTWALHIRACKYKNTV